MPFKKAQTPFKKAQMPFNFAQTPFNFKEMEFKDFKELRDLKERQLYDNQTSFKH